MEIAMEWLGYIPVIERVDSDGRVVWRQEFISNQLADEGQELLLQLAFQDTALTAFYMGATSGTLTELTNLSTMTGEPSTNGYARQTLTRNTTDWPTVGKTISADLVGTAQTGGAASLTLATDAGSGEDLYRGCLIELTSGVGQGQWGLVQSYVGVTKVATMVYPWRITPVAGTTYIVHSDFFVQSKQVTFSASGGPWGPVDKIFLCTVASGSAGKLLAFATMSTPQTLAAGESFTMIYRGTLRSIPKGV